MNVYKRFARLTTILINPSDDGPKRAIPAVTIRRWHLDALPLKYFIRRIEHLRKKHHLEELAIHCPDYIDYETHVRLLLITMSIRVKRAIITTCTSNWKRLPEERRLEITPATVKYWTDWLILLLSKMIRHMGYYTSLGELSQILYNLYRVKIRVKTLRRKWRPLKRPGKGPPRYTARIVGGRLVLRWLDHPFTIRRRGPILTYTFISIEGDKARRWSIKVPAKNIIRCEPDLLVLNDPNREIDIALQILKQEARISRLI